MDEGMNRNRNTRCRLREVDYRDVRQLYLENELLRVAVLTGKGADITELLYKPLDMDFLWHSANPVQAPGSQAVSRMPTAGSFLNLYEGGWQELFPSYGAPATYKGAEYGLHGEVCVVPWEYAIETDTAQELCVRLWVRTPTTPYLLERWMTLKTGDPTLYIREKITNESPVEMECMWGHHPALGQPFLDDSCEILLPLGGKPQAVTLDGSGVLSPRTAAAWPRFPLAEGGDTDLARIQSPVAKAYREYGIQGLERGECVVWNHNHSLGFRLGWEIDRFPILWIWEPNCASPNYPWYGRNYTLGVEPWSHLAASLDEVVENGAAIRLGPWKSIETELSAGVCLEKPGFANKSEQRGKE